MTILVIRTDRPEAEVGVYDGQKQLAYEKWQADRELAETIHTKINEILNKSSITMERLGAIIVYRGPGSFTGLRIGITVANTLAYALQIPIVGALSADWIADGVKKLTDGTDDKIVVPEYGSEPHITKARK